MDVRIGVLMLQGDFAEHRRTLALCGAELVNVRLREDLVDISGLIIPGGESTTIGKLLARYDLLDPIRQRAAEGMAIFGTCAGAILLAKDIMGYPDQTRLGLMDIRIERNAYGRQIDSFEADVPAPAFGDKPLRAVFIRAPVIRAVGAGVEVLAIHDNIPILVQQGKLLAGAFHPELTDDLRVHQYFLTLAD